MVGNYINKTNCNKEYPLAFRSKRGLLFPLCFSRQAAEGNAQLIGTHSSIKLLLGPLMIKRSTMSPVTEYPFSCIQIRIWS